jgi:mono/diheme cytochrome c family protein
MDARRLRLIALILAAPFASTGGGTGPRAEEPTVPLQAQGTPGRGLYLTNCRSCHGVLGVPTKLSARQYATIPNLADPAFWAGRSVDSVVVVLRNGVGRDMKSFSDKLTADEIRAVALYARSLARTP